MKHRRSRRKGGFLPFIIPAISAIAGAVSAGTSLYKAVKGSGRKKIGRGKFSLQPIHHKGGFYVKPTYGVPFV